ncbi:MAG: cysteine--tRNA ligase [Rhodobiaceae bacterium]|nr:cysteine--tRNA ligase [Rhodobiaceae bacterium]
MRLYNSKTKKKEIFHPVDEENVTMYVCGPTVYGSHHIGNARPAVVFDLLAKLLRNEYKNVTYARNITDVDDKIINAAIEQNVEISEITKKSTNQYHSDMKILNVEDPNKEPYATQFISEMVLFIEDLITKDNAYVSEGHVLFDINSYKSYGDLSSRDPKDMIAGSRVKVQDYKKNPLDFVLWKPSNENEIGWNSPWGRGRPGWHLECSTMILEIFGETIDIHGGGEDLRFPHHENECAQSFCRNDGKQLANFWLHNGMVQMADSKMSKSLGNILLIKDLLNDMPGEVIRLSLMSSHYRQPLKWSDDLVNQSKKTLNTFYSFLDQYEDIDITNINVNEEILSSLSDDINTPKAISVLHSMFKDLKKDPDNIELRSSFIKSANFMGLLFSKPRNWLIKEDSNVDTKVIDELIIERNRARQSKDFSVADDIRDKLLDMGVVLEDKNDITTWKKKND